MTEEKRQKINKKEEGEKKKNEKKENDNLIALLSLVQFSILFIKQAIHTLTK